MTNTPGVIEVRTGARGPAGADGAPGADGADGADGSGGGANQFTDLIDAPAAYLGKNAFVKSNSTPDGVVFRYSTPNQVDVRDYLSSGPREAVSDEDITTAVAAIVANLSSGDTHLKRRIYFPIVTDGGSGALKFDAASISWGSSAWNFMIDTQRLDLTSTWSLTGNSRLIGLYTRSGLPQFFKGPNRNRITAHSSWSSGAAPLIALDGSSGRNVIISDLSMDNGGTACTNCIKLDWDSHGLYRLHLTSDAAEALWVEHAFWVNMEDICVVNSGTVGANNYAAKFATAAGSTNVGIVRIRDFLCVAGGILFQGGPGTGAVGDIVIDECHSEGMGNGQALLNFDSSTGGKAVTGITVRGPGISDDVGGGVYLIRNTGSLTTNINIEGSWRFNDGVIDPASSGVIRGLQLLDGRFNQQGQVAFQDVNDSPAASWAGLSVSDRFPVVETALATDRLLISSPVGVPWVLGTVKNITQDPASWTKTGGGTLTTTGIPGPHGGTTNVGRSVGGTGVTVGSFSMTPALNDFFLVGVWVRGSNCPVADLFPTLVTTTAGFAFNNTGSDPSMARGDYIYNVDDDGWYWVSFLYKLTTVTGGAGTFTFTVSAGEDCDIFNPCVMHIPASAGHDEVGLMRYQRSWKGGVGGGAATAAPVAGDIAFPDGQNVMVKGKFVGFRDPSVIVNNTTAYTLSSTALSAIIEMSNSSASVVTIPPTTSDAIPVGGYFNIVRTGAGVVTVTTGSSVSLLSVNSARIVNGQYAMATLYKSTGDTWILGGSVSTV